MRSLLLIEHKAVERESEQQKNQADRDLSRLFPEVILESSGYFVLYGSSEELARKHIVQSDAVVLNLPLNEVKYWGTKLLSWKKIPMLWWCSAETATLSNAFCEDDLPVDGILTPLMTEQELHWAFHFGSKQCSERQQWQMERQQLEGRLEERKWIDMAKGILCDIKKVSEAEAYDLLRKQAMNERKRLVDVATSIVKVYQLLQEQK
ncbi:ANTAR domain-containing protein [Paenibacillus algorifonticola]|uniref:ANTAR domain-containing response regulator n=1 Tax=Paenibacillus algorifonticola TaxID=684063 RepID=UPI003D27078A